MSGTTLLLARHGHAHCNHTGTIGGTRGCTGLTDHGRDEAESLAARLLRVHNRSPITALYTSPLPRATETATYVAAALDTTAVTLPDLREPDYGTADGQPWGDVVARFGRIPAEHPYLPIAEGAETWTNHYSRVATALQHLISRHRDHTIAIIGHGETITAAAHMFLGLPPGARATSVFLTDNASLTTWQEQPLSWTRPAAGSRWALVGHNDTSHLHDV